MIHLYIKPLKNGCYEIRSPKGLQRWILSRIMHLSLVNDDGVAGVEVIDHGDTYERVENPL